MAPPKKPPSMTVRLPVALVETIDRLASRAGTNRVDLLEHWAAQSAPTSVEVARARPARAAVQARRRVDPAAAARQEKLNAAKR